MGNKTETETDKDKDKEAFAEVPFLVLTDTD